MSTWSCSECLHSINSAEHCPRFLECGHVFCTSCLASMCTNTRPVFVTCPHDNTRTLIDPNHGASCLPRHIVLLAQHQFVSGLASRSPALCEVCVDPHPPTQYCCECQQFMCDAVAVTHRRQRATQTHSLVSADDPTHHRSQTTGLCCVDHPQQPYSVFDSQCNRLVCGQCLGVGDHVGHRCEAIESVVAGLRGEFEELVNEAQRGVERLVDKQRSISEVAQKVERMATSTTSEITRYFAEIRKVVSTREAELIADLNKAVKETLFELHDQRQCISNIVACAQYSIETNQVVGTIDGLVAARERVRATANHVKQIVSVHEPQHNVGSRGVDYLNIWDKFTVRIKLKRRNARCRVRDLLAQLTLVECAILDRTQDDPESSDVSEGDASSAKHAINDALKESENGQAPVEQAGKTIRRILRRNTSLKELSLSESGLGPNGARALADALRANTSLTALVLPDNIIGDEGVHAIAAALQTNNQLAITFLDLRSNDIGDQGAQQLAAALRVNTTLSTVWLENNRIQDQGAMALLDMLQQNQTLRQLDHYDNQISGKISTKITNALNRR
eukprot:c25427_g1_i1.p1 GENE.c25427_g1_i1~~c25427_g1_i1.p1  ORF type:complete len:563 (+),score=99.88 c25427_g1_i1:37-1725(+)